MTDVPGPSIHPITDAEARLRATATWGPLVTVERVPLDVVPTPTSRARWRVRTGEGVDHWLSSHGEILCHDAACASARHDPEPQMADLRDEIQRQLDRLHDDQRRTYFYCGYSAAVERLLRGLPVTLASRDMAYADFERELAAARARRS